MKNPQGEFEDGIFGPNGIHPNPKTLPYPTKPLKTIYGETVEYIVPEREKRKLLRKLFPFGDPPDMEATMRDIHNGRDFIVRDYRVVEQNGYVMPVSPWFDEDGASVVDWQPPEAAESGVHVAKIDDAVMSAYNAGRADGFTGMPEGVAKPARLDGMSENRYKELCSAYADGYEDGVGEREDRRNDSFFETSPGQTRVSFRRLR